MEDVTPVQNALTLEAIQTALDELEYKWGTQYPFEIKSWCPK